MKTRAGTVDPGDCTNDLPVIKGKDLLFSGWVKGGIPGLGFVQPNGARNSVSEMTDGKMPMLWTRMGKRYSAEDLARASAENKDGQLVLMLSAGGDFLELRAFAAEPKSAGKGER